MTIGQLKRSELVPGSVDHFRATVQRLMNHYQTGWVSSTGEKLNFGEMRQREVAGYEHRTFGPRPSHVYSEPIYRDTTPATRGTWRIISHKENGLAHAVIEAYEQQNGSTLLEFYDGVIEGRPTAAIGVSYDEFCQLIIDEAKGKPTPAGAGNGQGEPRSYGLASLRQKLAEHFSIDELRTLCFDIGIKHENLPADTLDGMARELVSYCERACRIPELVAQCRKLRPNVSWD